MVNSNGKLARTCSCAVLILALAVGVMAVVGGNSLVSAQPCTAQLGPPTILTQQYLSFQVTVPVSTTCSFNTGQLYATGTAYDTVYNLNIGTANTVLSATYEGYGFTGLLQFNLPASAASHPVQFSVSIYSAQSGYWQQYNGGSLLTTTSATFVLGPSYLSSPYPYYSTYPTYPTYPSYPSYPTYPSYPYYSGNHYYYHSYPYYYQNHVGNYYHYYYYYHNGGYYNNHPCSGSRSHCTHP